MKGSRWSSQIKLPLSHSNSARPGLLSPSTKEGKVLSETEPAMPGVQRLNICFVPGVEGGILVTALDIPLFPLFTQSLKGSH
jgi:hypothetical protein